MVIRENELYKRLCGILDKALKSLGVSGYKVLQANQPEPTNSHGAVMLSRLSVRRYGWQGVAYSNAPEDNIDQMTEIVDYIDEATYQISAYRPRKAADNVSELTSYDVVSAIHMWLFSPTGISALADSGLQVFRNSDIRIQAQADDTDMPQFNPNFDVRAVIFNDAKFRIGAINDPDAVAQKVPHGPLMNPILTNIIQGHYTEVGKMSS